MIYKKKESVGSFLKKGEDVKDGDIVTILDEGKQVEGEYGIQHLFNVKAGTKEGNVSFNQTTINNLIEGYGEDSAKWVGKEAKVFAVKQSVAGKLLKVYYFLHPDTEETNDGFVIVKKKEVPPVIDNTKPPF